MKNGYFTIIIYIAINLYFKCAQSTKLLEK